MLKTALVVRIEQMLQFNYVVYNGIMRWKVGFISEDEKIRALFACVRWQRQDVVICKTPVLVPLFHGNDIGVTENLSETSAIVHISPITCPARSSGETLYAWRANIAACDQFEKSTCLPATPALSQTIASSPLRQFSLIGLVPLL